ncbi:MAG: alpha/beta fold hydrolase [Pseudomonadota bacterium]|nr:alpha/beta fold hydrolase [Pseudomonadota bacterium]
MSAPQGQRLAYRTGGAPDGSPWLAIHGGPGSGAQPALVQPLDAARHRILVLDQRGAGASRPRGRTAGNTLAALVGDMERLRQALGIVQWSLLAGSWGTVVALDYAQRHPARVKRLVLRGAFGLTRRELLGVLRPARAMQRRWPAQGWPLHEGVALPVALKQLQRQLRRRPPLRGPARTAVRYWQALEAAAAERGLRRSLRHAAASTRPGAPPPGVAAELPSAIRAAWAGLRRGLRQARAAFQRPRSGAADRLGWQKFRIQAHYLARRGFTTPAALHQAVRSLARQGVPVDWVHGRFDSICPPANSRRWADSGRRHGSAPVRLLTPHSGHLGGEPDMLRTLRALLAQC